MGQAGQIGMQQVQMGAMGALNQAQQIQMGQLGQSQPWRAALAHGGARRLTIVYGSYNCYECSGC